MIHHIPLFSTDAQSSPLLLGFIVFGYIALRVLRFISDHVATRSFVAKTTSSAIGLDAAEKGNTSTSRHSLAGNIPYELEKRAIMHKRWMMIGHDSQFKKPGDYRTYVVTDMPFLVVRGEDKKLRAFHNVCRHRAYTVARRPSGHTTRLSCRYHGWQYTTSGCLVKAPQFAGTPNFDMADNGLFQIHLEIDRARFVFVNFATDLHDSFPWSDISSPSLKHLNFDRTTVWDTELDASWRVASLLPWFVDPINFVRLSWRERTMAYLYLDVRPDLQYVDDGSFICHFGDEGSLLVSALPVSGKKTLIKCTFVPGAAETHSDELRAMVDGELKVALSKLKKDLRVNTNLDAQQSAVRERLDKFARHIDHHRRLEKMAGRKINPAVRVTGREAIDEEAEAICNSLDSSHGTQGGACPAENSSELEW